MGKLTRLKNLIFTSVDLCKKGQNPESRIVLFKSKGGQLEIGKAKWTVAYMNDLPDSAFLYIKPGGKKDEEGKTVPRDLRYFPYKDANGNIDLPHLRNAIARAPQADLPQDVIRRVQEKARRILERVSKSDYKKGDEIMTLKEILEKLQDDERQVVEKHLNAQEEAVKKSSDELEAKDAELAEAKQKLEAMEKELSELKKSAKGDEGSKYDDILKSASPEVRELFKKMEDENKKATDKIEKLEESMVRKEFIAKAEKQFENLPMNTEDLAEMLLQISKSDKDVYTKLEELLSKVNKAFGESEILKEVGTSRPSDAPDTITKIKKGATEIAKREGITMEQAEAKFLLEHPELYEEYEKEKGV